MGDPLSINQKNRDDNHYTHKVVDKNTLIPVGVAIGLCFLLFQAAAQWTTHTLKVSILEARVDKLEREVRNHDASMTFWRREVERKIGPLPDFSPSSVGATDRQNRVQASLTETE